MSNLALIDIDGERGIATLTLNRPDARNATSLALLEAVERGLDTITADDRIKVLILAGAGPAFCAGLDLNEARSDETTIRQLLNALSQVMRRIRRLDIATIALVRGAAIGGGFGLMVVTDFAITHPEVSIGYPSLDTGLSPALMAPWLIRTVGPSRARSLLLAGGTITGDDAHRMGIVTHLAPEDELQQVAQTLAERLATAPPSATAAMKRLLNELDDSISDDMLDRAATVSADVIASPETQQRLRELFGPPPARGED